MESANLLNLLLPAHLIVNLLLDLVEMESVMALKPLPAAQLIANQALAETESVMQVKPLQAARLIVKSLLIFAETESAKLVKLLLVAQLIVNKPLL